MNFGPVAKKDFKYKNQSFSYHIELRSLFLSTSFMNKLKNIIQQNFYIMEGVRAEIRFDINTNDI